MKEFLLDLTEVKEENRDNYHTVAYDIGKIKCCLGKHECDFDLIEESIEKKYLNKLQNKKSEFNEHKPTGTSLNTIPVGAKITRIK